MKAALGNVTGAVVRTAAPPDVLFEAPPRPPSVSLPPLRRISTAPGAPHHRPRSSSRFAWSQRFQLGDVLVVLSLVVLAFVILCAAFPAAIAPSLPTDMHSDAILARPGGAHWFGTDQFGRDVFSLVVYGARESVLIGVFAVSISCTVGVSIGLTAGYVGGWLDTALMRGIDIWMSIFLP